MKRESHSRRKRKARWCMQQGECVKGLGFRVQHMLHVYDDQIC